VVSCIVHRAAALMQCERRSEARTASIAQACPAVRPHRSAELTSLPSPLAPSAPHTWPHAQEVAAEAICALSSFDTGRPLLAPILESGLVFQLMDSKSAAARSAAASGYAKLGMVSTRLDRNSHCGRGSWRWAHGDCATLVRVGCAVVCVGSGM
jgi:hypothetical protein